VHATWPKLAVCAYALTLLSLAGCGDLQVRSVPAAAQSRISGNVHGGQQPISGATIQLYAASNGGDGSASTPLLTAPVQTDGSGSFNLNGLYTCPSASTNVYLTATGGNPGLKSGTLNANIAAMVALGPCGSLSTTTYVQINEMTTVAAVYALAPFMQSYTAVGSAALDSQLLSDAFVTAGQLVNTGTGSAPGVAVPIGQTVPVSKIKALSNILSTCINSAGGQAGDGSACGSLFAYATPASGAAPNDTIAALLNIANNPTSNVSQLFFLTSASAPFQPTMASVPSDWTLSLISPTPSPAFSPAPGTYSSSPWITLTDSNASAQIYYTTDGSTPTASSNLYSGAIPLPATAMFRAIAVAAGIGSLPVAGIYTVATPTIALSPATVSLTQSQTQAFTATVAGTSNTAVTWSLTPALGTISATGVYTAPASVVSAQTVTVTAASVADPAVSATATVSLAPPVSVSVTPGIVTLTPSQSQAFIATVANTSNTAVTWSVSPAVGSISPAGLYTAPAAISSTQTITVTAVSAANTAALASATVAVAPAGATYYLSPTGNDANNGKSSGAAWLTPNHAVNCGDVIVASPGTSYSAANFASGKWGTVTCPSNNNVAWLKCATFDACKISVTSGTLDGMRVSASYWGVQGWEVSNTAGGSGGGSCFAAAPATWSASIHHVIFANDIANVCPLGGLGSGNNATAGVDYFAVIGSIAYAAGQSNTYCGSGISVYEPVASDSAPGTHIYVAGNLSYSTTNPVGCYDGNGIIFDTFDGSQTPLPQAYVQQGVIDNNISLSNGGVGVRIEYNDAGTGSTHAQIYARHNTTWNNSIGTYQFGNPSCGEFQLYKTLTTAAYLNLAATNQAGCYGDSSNPLYAYSVSNADSTSSVDANLGWSATNSYSQSLSSGAFTFGATNIFGINPGFAHAVTPGAPNCATAASVPNCIATVIANFTPATTTAIGYGYQVPGTSPTYDTLFPQWLCNVNLPPGLVTMGCLTH
jgi:hypothetical protein